MLQAGGEARQENVAGSGIDPEPVGEGGHGGNDTARQEGVEDPGRIRLPESSEYEYGADEDDEAVLWGADLSAQYQNIGQWRVHKDPNDKQASKGFKVYISPTDEVFSSLATARSAGFEGKVMIKADLMGGMIGSAGGLGGSSGVGGLGGLGGLNGVGGLVG